MEQVEFLLNELKYSYDEEDWYPTLKDAISGLTYEQAVWKPEGCEVNSIWETTNHILYFQERLLYQLRGQINEFKTAPNNDATFKNREQLDEQSWTDTVNKVEEIHKQLEFTIASLNNETESKSPSVMGVIRHDAYHTGQIILLRKMQGSWPEKRMFEF